MGNYSQAAMAAFAAAMANNSLASTETLNDLNTSSSNLKDSSDKSSRNSTETRSSNSSQNNFLASNTAAAIASSIMAAAAASAAVQNNLVNTSNGSMNPVKHSIKLCRRRKARTVFSDQQLNGLEKRFESQKYLSTPERVELANNLGLSETQVIKRKKR